MDTDTTASATFEGDELERNISDAVLASRRRLAIGLGVDAVHELVDRERDRYREKCRKAERENRDAPESDLPRAESPRWVREAAKALAGPENAPEWMRTDEVAEQLGCEDLLYHLPALRDLQEFATFATIDIEVRWSAKAMIRSGLMIDETRPGRVKVVPTADRDTWEGGAQHAPGWRMELSLPWFLLAEEHERRRGLHSLLAYCGLKAGKPAIRKPDIEAHATTLGRFGPSGLLEAQAIAHAVAHPSTPAELRRFRFDLAGQGVLWGDIDAPAVTPQRSQGSGGRLAGKPRVSGKDAAAEQTSAPV